MSESLPRFNGAVWLSMLIAVALNIVPLPAEWSVWRPDWIVLALIHWALVIRQNTSLFMAFFMGLLMDVLSSSLLGQHAFCYVVVAYFAVRLGLRMTAEAFLQQFALVFVVTGIYMLFNLWIRGVTGNVGAGLLYWAPLLGSLIIWPVFHGLFSYLSVQRKVV